VVNATPRLPHNFQVVTIDSIDKEHIRVKFTLERAMKAQRGSRGIALLFL
jgi:hypothetical protein